MVVSTALPPVMSKFITFQGVVLPWYYHLFKGYSCPEDVFVVRYSGQFTGLDKGVQAEPKAEGTAVERISRIQDSHGLGFHVKVIESY